jgi:geranylgeranyl diphosphate synthase type II
MKRAENKLPLSEIMGIEKDRLDDLIENCFPGDDKAGDRPGMMKYAMTSGGKRLRPILCLLAFRCAGGEGKGIYPFALLWEIIHTFSLVHDDLPIMDDDDFRRGKPTLHRLYGTRAAILAGVELLCYCYELTLKLVEENDLSYTQIKEIYSILSESSGFHGMIGGQMMDLHWEGRDFNSAVVDTIHDLKTARMIEGSIAIGAILGGENGARLKALREYGICLGLAYQIADDLLDRRSDFSRMGKVTGRDSILKKATFPSVYGEEESERRLLAEVEKAGRALDRVGLSDSIFMDVLEYVRDRGTGMKKGQKPVTTNGNDPGE